MAAAETDVGIRPGCLDDVDSMRAIELDAGRLFAEIGMDDVAAHEPPSASVLAAYVDAGRAWVAVEVDGEVDGARDDPVGFVIVDVVDGAAHIEQVSVRLSHARRGIGRALIDHVARWACDRSLGSLTLTTFADVAWNGPYYERIGFRRLADRELGPGLAAIVAHEAELGLDPTQRVAMVRPVTGAVQTCL